MLEYTVVPSFIFYGTFLTCRIPHICISIIPHKKNLETIVFFVSGLLFVMFCFINVLMHINITKGGKTQLPERMENCDKMCIFHFPQLIFGILLVKLELGMAKRFLRLGGDICFGGSILKSGPSDHKELGPGSG